MGPRLGFSRPSAGDKTERGPNKYPTYRDITIIGNMVAMCESDDRNLSEPSTNCAELSAWLSE